MAATLTHKAAGSARGVATDEDARGILVSHLPRALSPGEGLTVEITRPALAERGRAKLAQGRFGDDGPAPMPVEGTPARFPTGSWEDLWRDAWDGEVAFDGGRLIFDVARAMTLVDIDGGGSPRELALAAVPALATALPRFDMGGSIGIDFPTLQRKDDRKAIDRALGQALAHWPHERTAMNGFGFVQVVARLARPSLLHLMASDRVGMAARFLLRQAEREEGTGRYLALTCHPAVAGRIRPPFVELLERRSGRAVRILRDPRIAIGSGQAQITGDG